MIFCEVNFQCFDHSDDLFLAHLLSAAERIFVRTVVEQCVMHQVFVADEQSRALRATHSLATAEGD